MIRALTPLIDIRKQNQSRCSGPRSSDTNNDAISEKIESRTKVRMPIDAISTVRSVERNEVEFTDRHFCAPAFVQQRLSESVRGLSESAPVETIALG
jgi:hypothetical protein